MKPTEKSKHVLLLLVGLCLPTLITWLYFDFNRESSPTVQQIVYGIGKIAQAALPILAIWLAVDRGFSFHWPKRDGMLIGVIFGLAVVALMLGIYYFRLIDHPMIGPLRENILGKISGFGVDAPWKFFIMGLWYAVFHSLFEEYYWRWFVFPQCQRLFPLWASIVISSVGFMAHHVLVLAFYLGWDSLFTYQVSGSIAIGGIFWAWLYHRTQSLYPVWLSHGIVDAGIFWMGFQMVKESL